MNIKISNTEGTVYNHVRRSYLRPKEFEEFCPVCKGTGEGNISPTRIGGLSLCERCWGKGIIDWIDKVMKK